MAREDTEDTYGGRSLAGALTELAAQAEPPMPDLVAGAVARGTRLRRRRRAGKVLGSAALLVAVAGSGVTLQSLLPGSRQPPPAAAPTWYPSAELLRSIVPGSFGAIDVSKPARPMIPGHYFRVTTARGVSDLYVSVARTSTEAFPSRTEAGRPGACADSAGRLVASPWNDLLQGCSLVRKSSGGTLLLYLVGKEPLPADTKDFKPVSSAVGVSYVTPDGWTVQVVAGPLDTARPSADKAAPTRDELYALATDPRLFGAVREGKG